MKKIFLGFMLCFSLLFANSFDDGLEAYESGDYKKAFEIWQPLAENGDALAQNNLGFMYIDGQEIPQDYKKAKYYYELVAKNRHSDTLQISSQLALGNIYANGHGVQQTIKKLNIIMN